MKMMKVLASLLAVLLLLSACGTPAPQNAQGSSTTTTTTNPPATTDSRSIEEILCQAYEDQYGTEFDIASLEYVGVHNQIHLAIFRTPGWIVQTTEVIGGFPFVTADSNTLDIFMNGKVISLKDAYEEKLINYADLEALYKVYITKYPYYSSVSIQEIMCQAFEDQQDTEFDIASLEYFGCYEGIHLAIFHGNAWPVPTTVNIGGYSFVTGDSRPVSVYMDGKIMTLKEAYEEKQIDDAALEGLYKLYTQR